MILIAVHSRTIRMQIERLCVEGGVTKVAALLAATVAEAKAALAAHPVAGVVLDDWFPDGRGGELLGEIRVLYPTLPVLSIATELGAEQGLKPDAEVLKAELVTSLVPRMRTMMRSRASESAQARVLVVDDSRTYREQLRASLAAAGYKVILAETGEEGVRCAFEQRPDAVLVDSMLPGINGAAVIRRIRSESATRRTPCLLLTASEDSREELEALEAGADTFVRKSEGHRRDSGAAGRGAALGEHARGGCVDFAAAAAAAGGAGGDAAFAAGGGGDGAVRRGLRDVQPAAGPGDA